MVRDCPRCNGTGLWTPDFVPWFDMLSVSDQHQWSETGEVSCTKCDGTGLVEAPEKSA